MTGRADVVEAIRGYQYYRDGLSREYLNAIATENGLDYAVALDEADKLVETVRRAFDIKNYEVG